MKNVNSSRVLVYNMHVFISVHPSPLGFSNPTGGGHMLIFTNNTAKLLYRQTVLSSTANVPNMGTTGVKFQVCTDGKCCTLRGFCIPVGRLQSRHWCWRLLCTD